MSFFFSFLVVFLSGDERVRGGECVYVWVGGRGDGPEDQHDKL